MTARELRVLFLAPPPTEQRTGLVSRHTFIEEEARSLAAAGVQIYTLSPSGREADVGSIHLRSLRRLRLARPFAAVRAAVKLLRFSPMAPLTRSEKWLRLLMTESAAVHLARTERIDVIHSHFAWPGGVGGQVVKALTGLPLVTSLRGADLNVDVQSGYGARRDPFYDRAVQRLLRVADSTWYGSRFMLDRGLSLGARRDRTRVIRKGVDLGRFRPLDAIARARLRDALGVGGSPVIMTAAGLVPVKGVHFVLEALATLRERFAFRFVVCGRGPEQPRLKELSARLGLADRTTFTDGVGRDRIWQYFSAADVFVLASVKDAAPNVVLEALASGVPVVCSDAGGPAEYVAHGETGFVVPVRDPSAIAGAVARLLQDPDAREKMGRAARLDAERNLAYPRMIAEMVEAYRQAVSKN